MNRAPWLDEARAQSKRLADERAARGVRLELPSRAPSYAWRLAAVALIAAMVSASGAWAWVAHRHTPPTSLAPTESVPVVRPRAIVVQRVPIAVIAKRARKIPAPKPPTAPIAPSSTGDFVEPDGEVIFAKPPVKLEPLFNVKEYKSRGVLVH